MLNVNPLDEWHVDLSLDPDQVDLTNCDREPIHIPGMIQPHGVLLVLDPSTWSIIQVSENTAEHLGIATEQILGSPLSQWLTDEQLKTVIDCSEKDFEAINPLNLTLGQESTPFNGIIHRSQTAVVLELETKKNKAPTDFFDFYHYVKLPLKRLQTSRSLDEVCTVVTEEVRRICGFDRVMIYQFAADGSGSVVAEDRREDLESFLGLHYPDSDIPRQAKKLYASNKLRIIPDRSYSPVALCPENNPLTEQPTDLSYSVLRSVSPVHLEYMGNMGVAASMSISIVHEGQLWGLIACHHDSPYMVDYELRAVCEFIGEIAAIEIAAKQDRSILGYRISRSELQAGLIHAIAQSDDLITAMARPELVSLINADGVVVVQGEEQLHVGHTPSQHLVGSVINFLQTQPGEEAIYQTHCLSSILPEASEETATASGLLALEISKRQCTYVLWFRQEVIQTVNWGGEPAKKLVKDESGKLRIAPRESFARWTERVRGCSRSWLSCEQELVLELRVNLLTLLLRNAEQLANANRELARSNDELDAFAYIASHDLKEPLRGIYNYSSFLIEDYEAQLDEDGVHKLQTLMRLTKRMEELINSLLHFSRLGRVELNLQQVSLPELLADVKETFTISHRTQKIEIQVAEDLPVIQCDRVQISELYTNLISNAIKYNDAEHKKIEVGILSGDSAQAAIAKQGLVPESSSTSLYYVQDNGIGIRERHLTSAFRIFKRLNSPKRYGEGTGAGLTIVKKIIERHGGIIWVESVYGKGSTFYFTLS